MVDIIKARSLGNENKSNDIIVTTCEYPILNGKKENRFKQLVITVESKIFKILPSSTDEFIKKIMINDIEKLIIKLNKIKKKYNEK